MKVYHGSHTRIDTIDLTKVNLIKTLAEVFMLPNF